MEIHNAVQTEQLRIAFCFMINIRKSPCSPVIRVSNYMDTHMYRPVSTVLEIQTSIIVVSYKGTLDNNAETD